MVGQELAQLAKGYVQNLPIDARKWSKETLQRAYVIGLIERGKKRKWQFTRTFDFAHMLDADALWYFCESMIAEYSGFSISKSREWNNLNIYSATEKHFSTRDIQDMERILVRLDVAGYIWFNGAGTVWSIRQREALAA